MVKLTQTVDATSVTGKNQELRGTIVPASSASLYSKMNQVKWSRNHESRHSGHRQYREDTCP